jgi:hypothetical protein
VNSTDFTLTAGKGEAAKTLTYSCAKRARLNSDYFKTIDLYISADNKLVGTGREFRVFNSKVKLNHSEPDKVIKFTVTPYRSFMRIKRANIAAEALPETSRH